MGLYIEFEPSQLFASAGSRGTYMFTYYMEYVYIILLYKIDVLKFCHINVLLVYLPFV